MTTEEKIKQAAKEYADNQGGLLTEKTLNAFIAGANFGREIGMKTLSVKQPWAYLLCAGVKDIENRTWKLPEKYKGERILIHASAAKMKSLQKMLTLEQKAIVDKKLGYEYDWDKVFAKSAIIGSVRFVDCVINHPSIWAEKSETNCSERCRNSDCEHFIEWGFQSLNDCRSCKLIGQSYEVEEVPKDCPKQMKIDKIYNWVATDAVLFEEPILNVKGKLGFWDYDLPEEYEIILNKALGL